MKKIVCQCPKCKGMGSVKIKDFVVHIFNPIHYDLGESCWRMEERFKNIECVICKGKGVIRKIKKKVNKDVRVSKWYMR